MAQLLPKSLTSCSKQSSEMQGVLEGLETSAPNKSDPIKPILLPPHLFPCQF